MRTMLANYLLDGQVTSIGDALDLIPDYQDLLRLGRTVPLRGSEVMQEYRELTKKIVYVARDPRDSILDALRIMDAPEAKRTKCVKYLIAPRFLVSFTDGRGTWPQSIREWTDPAALRQHFPTQKC